MFLSILCPGFRGLITPTFRSCNWVSCNVSHLSFCTKHALVHRWRLHGVLAVARIQEHEGQLPFNPLSYHRDLQNFGTVPVGRLATHYQPVVRQLFFAAVEGGEREDWRGDLHIRSQLDLDVSDNAAQRAQQVEKGSRQYREDLAELFRFVSKDLQTRSFVFVHCYGWYDSFRP